MIVGFRRFAAPAGKTTAENFDDEFLTGDDVDWGSLWGFYNQTAGFKHEYETACSKYEHQSEYVLRRLHATATVTATPLSRC